MPRYKFIGSVERVLLGLSHDAETLLHRFDADGEVVDHGQPEGSTVTVQPGDEVTTADDYIHSELEEVEGGVKKELTPALTDLEKAAADGAAALGDLSAAAGVAQSSGEASTDGTPADPATDPAATGEQTPDSPPEAAATTETNGE